MITLDNISYKVGAFNLNASLEIRDDEYFVLVGRTGCGKTTLVECLCGLKSVTGGRIMIDGTDVTLSAPRDRRIGYVPQDGALFDHLRVRDNVLFPLKVRKAPRSEMERTLVELSDRTAIGHLLDRPIPGLSGGERQRVALARALAAKPRALLFDEPVSALDESLRDRICGELVALQRGLRIPVLHVCHSSEEARLVATRMAVMRDGVIEQVAPPAELFDRPRNASVANFLRLENVFEGTGVVADGASFIESNGVLVRADAPRARADFVIRPWQITVSLTAPEINGATVVRGHVTAFSCVGALARIQIDGPLPLVAQVSRNEAARLGLAKGQVVHLSFPPDAVWLLQNPL